jgi:ParB family chromosome partitioning protein
VKRSKEKAKKISLELIDEPRGVIRLDISPESVSDLAASIQEVGLLQPIVVRPCGERFEIVFGHRRFLAHKELKADEVDCVVRVLSDLECAVLRGTENIQRDDLSPIEEAATYSDLHDVHGLTVKEVAKKMGKTVGIVKRRLDLLKMPAQLQKAVHEGLVSYGVAEELFRLRDEGQIDYYLSYAIDHGCTVAVARMWVNDYRKAQRGGDSDIVEGGGGVSPLESKPIFVACDLCLQAMEVGKEKVMRICLKCAKTIQSAVSGD